MMKAGNPPLPFLIYGVAVTFLVNVHRYGQGGSVERCAVSLQHLPARGLLILQTLESKGYIWLWLPFFFVKVAALNKWRLNRGTFRAEFGHRPLKHRKGYEENFWASFETVKKTVLSETF